MGRCRLLWVFVWMLLPVAAAAGDQAGGQGGGVRVETVERETAAGPIRGLVAWVDLSDARVSVTVTDLREGERFAFKPADAVADETDATLVVNANYFSATAPIGLVVSDGQVVSPPRGVDPVLLLVEQGDGLRAVVIEGVDPPTDLVGQAVAGVAGVGATTRQPGLGSLLLRGGENLGATARVAGDERHPRTAAGVSADGRTLILMAIDGRQEGWSVGVTLPELADLMAGVGAVDALNLDGGGSTSFVYRAGGGSEENRPSDGSHRAVVNHWVVKVDPGGEGDADED